MGRRRLASLVLAAALGVGVAAAVAAQGGGVPACANKKTGKVRGTTRGGGCRASDFLITISGSAFKRAKGGTLTINGVAFKGTPRTGTLPNSLTINGTSFESGQRGTITINGMPLTGTLPAGPPGPEGKAGPPGPAFTPGVATETLAQKSVTGGGGPQTLASHDVTAGNRRLLVTGGMNLVCNPCPEAVAATIGVLTDGTQAVRRKTAAMKDTGTVAIAEVITCGPCTVSLAASVPASAGGEAATIDVSDIRLGIVDLGPA